MRRFALLLLLALGLAACGSSVSRPKVAMRTLPRAAALRLAGVPVVGQTLTTSNGTWTNNPTSFAYQWQRCTAACSNIAGATTSTYTVQSGDVGNTIQAIVTASDSAGSASQASAPTGTVSAGPSPGLHVVGNQLQSAAGQPVQLHGVASAGSSYACDAAGGGYGFTDALTGDAAFAPMRANGGGTLAQPWNINSVWFAISQDCWLGLYGANPAYSISGSAPNLSYNYVNYVKAQVVSMEKYGIYPVLGFGLGSPYGSRNQYAGDAGEETMPNNSHEPLLWEEIANTFKNDPNVIFKIYQEPYPNGTGVDQATWACWANGDVQYLPAGDAGHLPADPSNYAAYTPPAAASSQAHCHESSTSNGQAYSTVGMQSLINVIRGTGATNIIQVPGVAWANALSCSNIGSPTPSQCGFLAPNLDGVLSANGGAAIHDTLSSPQLMATTDDYPAFSQFCGATNGTPSSLACFTSEYKPVASVMPIAMGEIAPGGSSGTDGAQKLVAAYDAIGQSYYGSQWTLGDGLITSYGGAVDPSWGTWFEAHIAQLP